MRVIDFFKGWAAGALFFVSSIVGSECLAEDVVTKFAPLMMYRGNWSGSDTYKSASEAASDYMRQFEKINSAYGPCMATLSQRKPAGCSRVDQGGISADSQYTYNGKPWRHMIKIVGQSVYMDGYGKTDTSTSESSVTANLLVICPVDSVVQYQSQGSDTKYWCEKRIPLVKKNKPCAGNPINIATGKKQQWETDYSSSDGLELKRFYANQYAGWQMMPLPNVGRGDGQNCGSVTDYYKYNKVDDRSQLDFSKRTLSEVVEPICLGGAERSADIMFHTEEGISLEFYDYQSEGFLSAQSDAKIIRLLPDGVEGIAWRMLNPNGSVLEFDQSGYLRVAVNGKNRLEYSYQDKHLAKVVAASGREIRFEYANDLLTKAITPEGDINYVFAKSNSALTPGKLLSVIGLDGVEQQYFYEDSRYPLALTGAGIKGKPVFATWKYDGQGLAIESSHAGGAEKVTFDYSKMFSVPARVTVTNPLLKKTTYEFSTIANRRELTKVMGEPSTNCMAANQLYEYYPDGHIQSQTDWNGNKTYFTYDSRGRELTKTLAYGTADAKTTQTCWHPTLNQPSRIIEPTKITLFDYTATGQLKSQTVKPRPAGAVDCSTAL